MFSRDHHIRIASILQKLNGDLLAQKKCWFGGGTAILLLRGEYRESVDIDFLVSHRDGFRDLRHLLTGADGLSAICRNKMELTPTREIRADQYGIRTMLRESQVEIKFEIILEARIQFDEPSESDHICGVSTLTAIDMAASKLLANSDRWADDSVFSRDLIDLAMLNLPHSSLNLALKKATAAYGESVKRDLNKAIEKLSSRGGRLEECMVALKMDTTPSGLLWQRIRNLRFK